MSVYHSPNLPASPSSRFAFSTHTSQQAYYILYAAFILLPFAAGLDKFFNMLCYWDEYLSPAVPRLLHITAPTFMHVVGVVEICAAILVALRPQIGAYIVALWLWGIVCNLLLVQGYYDIALRDFGLSLGAIALGRLSHEFGSNAWGP